MKYFKVFYFNAVCAVDIETMFCKFGCISDCETSMYGKRVEHLRQDQTPCKNHINSTFKCA